MLTVFYNTIWYATSQECVAGRIYFDYGATTTSARVSYWTGSNSTPTPVTCAHKPNTLLLGPDCGYTSGYSKKDQDASGVLPKCRLLQVDPDDDAKQRAELWVLLHDNDGYASEDDSDGEEDSVASPSTGGQMLRVWWPDGQGKLPEGPTGEGIRSNPAVEPVVSH